MQVLLLGHVDSICPMFLFTALSNAMDQTWSQIDNRILQSVLSIRFPSQKVFIPAQLPICLFLLP